VSVEPPDAAELTPQSQAEVSAPPAMAPVALPAPVLTTLATPSAASTPISRRAGAALTRAQELSRQLVPQLQYQISRLGVAGQAGLVGLVAAAAVAMATLVPAYHAVQNLNADFARAQHPGATASIEQAAPQLLASLPTRAQIPAVLGQVYAEAKAAGVPLDTGRYTYAPANSKATAHYEFEFPIKAASYPSIRTFINRTLTVVPAASLDKLHVERKAVGDQTVNADIGFVVFVRGGDTP